MRFGKMELTRKQEEGLRIAIDRYNHNEPYTVIAGYAGTGKSTLINFIIARTLSFDNKKANKIPEKFQSFLVSR